MINVGKFGQIRFSGILGMVLRCIRPNWNVKGVDLGGR